MINVRRFQQISKKKFYLNGDVYVGLLKDDKRHGKGTMTYVATEATYTGAWLNDKRHGNGIMTYNDGTSY